MSPFHDPSRRAFLALPAQAPLGKCREREFPLQVERRPRGGWNITSRFCERQLALLSKLNRADLRHLKSLDVQVSPSNWDLPELEYGPFPPRDPRLEHERKILIVDIRWQAFAADEGGLLVRWGPVSSGSASHPAPEGSIT